MITKPSREELLLWVALMVALLFIVYTYPWIMADDPMYNKLK